MQNSEWSEIMKEIYLRTYNHHSPFHLNYYGHEEQHYC